MIKDLFGNALSETEENNYTEAISLKNDKRPAKEIFFPSANERKRLEKILDSYNLSDLQDYLDPCYKFARKYRLYYLDEKGKEKCPQAVTKIISGEKKYKKDWVAFLAIMRYYRNLHYFLDDMSEGEKKLMELVIANHYVPESEAEKVLGEKCTHKIKGHYYYEHTELIPKLSFWYERRSVIGYDPTFRYSRYRSHISQLALQRGLRHDLAKVLHPEFFTPKKLEKIPSEENLITYNNELAIHTIFPMLRVMYKTNQIDFGSSKCAATTVKKVAKMTGVREFFQTDDKDGCRLAALLLTNIYCLDAAANGVGDFDIQDDIKSIWVDMSDQPSYFPALILSHITGFRKNQMCFSKCEDICNNVIAALKTFGKDNKWIEAENICNIARNWDDYAASYCLWLDSYEFEKMTLKNNYDEKDIFSDNIISELTYPFMKGFIFMLAVFGMAEIAYSKEPAPDATCFYDTLRYVRLTPLGEYAVGNIERYEQPKNEAAAKLFELYEDNLMVKSLEEVNPYESVLNNLATPISKHLYKVSYESFLGDCTCKSDITTRINMFRDYICKEPPANWKQFFKDMEDRCKPMKAPQKKYSLLQIPSDNKDLQRIILSDPVIRKYTLKAEAFILLVETSNKGKVVDALKKYGYLL